MQIFLVVLGIYLAIGCVFALAFAFVGAAAVDANARNTGFGFKVLSWRRDQLDLNAFRLKAGRE